MSDLPRIRFVQGQLAELLRRCPNQAREIQFDISTSLGRPNGADSINNTPLASNVDDVQNLLGKITPDKKYFFVIDLDNTIWGQHDNLTLQELVMQRHLDFPFATLHEIRALEESTKYQIKPTVLTARTSTDVQGGNDLFGGRLPLLDLDKYCSNGIVHCKNLWGTRFPEGLTFSPRLPTKTLEAWRSEAVRVLRKITELDPSRVKMTFAGDANAFYISFQEDSLKFKDQLTKFICGKEDEHFKWESVDSKDGYLRIFVNKRLPFTKADGLDFLLEHQKVDLTDPNIRIVVFGDSSSDLMAMQRAKEILPRHKVMNVRVGGAIDDSCIDYSFRDINDTQRFFAELHRKTS